MTLRSDGRRVISATMQPELYDRLYAHCKELDIPVTVFVREAISRALPPEGSDCGWAVLRPDHGHAAVDP